MLQLLYLNLAIVTIKRRICDALNKIFKGKFKEIMRTVVPIFFIFSCHA